MKKMTSKFKVNCYHRIALTYFFSRMKKEYPNLNYVIGTSLEQNKLNFTVVGEMFIEKNSRGDTYDIMIRTLEKFDHITLEFTYIGQPVEAVVIKKKMPANIKVKYPEELAKVVEPFLKYLEPEEIVVSTFTMMLHATIDDFDRTTENVEWLTDKEKLHNLDYGMRFSIMGSKTIKYMIYGVQDDKLVYYIKPKNGVRDEDLIIDLNELVFVPNMLYQYIDTIIVPA